MGKTQTQARWRASTDLQRLEVCLERGTVTALDRLAKARGTTRAGIIAALVAEQPAQAKASQSDDTNGDQGPRAASQPPQAGSSGQPRPAVTWRKAKPADRNGTFGYEWIAVVDDEPLLGLKRDDVYGWRGKYLQNSLSYRWAKAKTRDAVVAALLDLPEAYR